MDNELYYHRVILETDLPSKVSAKDNLVEVQILYIFIAEAIEDSFRVYKLKCWIRFKFLDSLLEDYSHKRYFNHEIGWAVCHHCAVDNAWSMATNSGFDLNVWLELSSRDDFGQYIRKYLGLVIDNTKPANVSMINGLAFASLIARKAVQKHKRDLVSLIIWDVVNVFIERFPFEWIYHDLNQWVQAYKVRHEDLHRT
ncbi:unnamed protein product [Larinioides sclopetarius]|uniref:Uncharacterized protein n=1 Tax=Larinioides sclopetarius TaxID=280406 RepID=A0AAV1Z5Q9_9ARAC